MLPPPTPDSASVAFSFEERLDAVVDLWLSRGPTGPTFGSPEAGDEETMRRRYLVPLSRVLVGALRGSDAHRAVYLDERTRYAPASRTREESDAWFREHLPDEFEALAAAIDRAGDDAVIRALATVHEDLTRTPPASQRVLLVGDCVFVETKAFLAPLGREAGRPTSIGHTFFSANQPLDARDSEIARMVEGSAPDVIGISLFTYEGVPA